MRYGKIIFLPSIFLISCLSCAAQQGIIINYSANDGLVSNNIRRIYQDAKGFLWISTWEGISKYDGHRFTNFTTANGLSHALVNDFSESGDGKLYLVNNGGNIDFIERNRVTNHNRNVSLVKNRFLRLKGKIIVTTDKNGFYELKHGSLLKPKQPFPSRSYTNIITITDTSFLAISDSVIQLFNLDYTLLSEVKANAPVFTEQVLYMDSKKRIWVGQYPALKNLLLPSENNLSMILVPVPQDFDIPLLRESPVNEILEDSNGIFWIATFAGVACIRPDGSHSVLTAKNGLISSNVGCLFQDREKNLWFGTELGLSKLVTRSGLSIYSTADGLLSNNLSFVLPLSQKLLVASNTGVLQGFNKSTRDFIDVASRDLNSAVGIVKGKSPLALYNSKELMLLDTNQLILNSNTTFTFGGKSVYYCIATATGDYFLSDHFNLYFISSKSGRIVNVLSIEATVIFLDSQQNLWVGTWTEGVYRIRYSTAGDSIHVNQEDRFLKDKEIRSIFEDSRGFLWVGTRYNGVYNLDIQKKVLQKFNFSQSNGLSSNWIKNITEDEKGNIWLVFYQGLDKLVKQDTGFRIFNFSKVYNYYASIRSIARDRNSLWLATSDGLVQIADTDMEQLETVPVYITGITISGKDYSLDSGKKFSHRTNHLQFEFSAPGFINEKQIFYSYRLIGGSDTGWTVPGNIHTVSFANLRPDQYRFEVRALSWNGIWGSAAVFDFEILPPFWQTWWFITFSALLLATGVYWMMRKRIAKIRHEADMKNKIAQTEMMALRAQMNPHFIFNCLNSIDNLIQNNQKEKATSYLARFAKLIRAILENSKQEVVPVWKELETLKLYLDLELLRCDDKFEYQLNISEELQHGDYKMPPLVIQPYVENAIQHGLMNKASGERLLSVNGTAVDGKIKFVIEDNGVGRQQAQAFKELNRPSHNSLGLAITRERIDLHNQASSHEPITISDRMVDNQPAGTRVEIILENK